MIFQTIPNQFKKRINVIGHKASKKIYANFTQAKFSLKTVFKWFQTTPTQFKNELYTTEHKAFKEIYAYNALAVFFS